tara:strand:- start:2408 stop:2653 length:246 start_codon:yes stop_codon:yes gene_type:complete
MSACGKCKKELDAPVKTLIDIVKGRQSSFKSQIPHNFLFLGDLSEILASDTKFKQDLNEAATQRTANTAIQCPICKHINFF